MTGLLAMANEHYPRLGPTGTRKITLIIQRLWKA
jgi:hypothetical protein